VALLIAGYEQSQIERAIEGSTWMGHFAAQGHPWFVQAMKWRQISGWAFVLGYVLLVWDLLTIGRRETRLMQNVAPEAA
jgi:nitric oxide reductase subunit B